MKRGKKYVEAAKAVDRANLYDISGCYGFVKEEVAVAKFDETIEVHIKTGCDGRHADQQIRGAVVLPHGTGKKFAFWYLQKMQRQTKQRLQEQICGSRRTDTEDPERKLVRVRRSCCYTGHDGCGWTFGTCPWTLKGLMPNPKAGTVTMDVTKAVQDIKAGKIEYRLDKTNIIHVPIGKGRWAMTERSVVGSGFFCGWGGEIFRRITKSAF